MNYLSIPSIPCLVACVLLTGCSTKGDPFAYVPVSGKVAYEDGTLLPVAVQLTFYSVDGSVNLKTHPRPGRTMTDQATGQFRDVTGHRYAEGLVPGRHRVTLGAGNGQLLPKSVASPEYADQSTTPLEVDTAKIPFEIKVKKPK
jgi:hypothetical protein